MEPREDLPIIFRKWKNGDVIAFFPTEVDSLNQNECMSYMHTGQHGNATASLIAELNNCYEVEYKTLLKELKGIYSDCNLVVVHHSSRSYYSKRLKKVKGYLGMK